MITKYGRIPPETLELFQKTVNQVKGEVLMSLPSNASAEVRAYTIETILEVVFRDWRENENTDGLEPADVRDLSSFVAMAVALAGSDLNGLGCPVYQATLKGLLEDWLYNWNAPGDPGPPGPID
jgi:hypothetical protein